MDDIPLPFQTDPHHLGLLVQESPMLSPNPPPSVVESNGQNLQHNASSVTTNTLASGQSTAANNPTLNSLSNASNFTNNPTTTTNTTNVIINNIKTNTTSIGTTNLDSGVVHPTEGVDGDEDGKGKPDGKESTVRHRWHTCPELHKAMDGVTYIADHTKKEEESTRGELPIF